MTIVHVRNPKHRTKARAGAAPVRIDAIITTTGAGDHRREGRGRVAHERGQQG